MKIVLHCCVANAFVDADSQFAASVYNLTHFTTEPQWYTTVTIDTLTIDMEYNYKTTSGTNLWSDASRDSINIEV